ncbi:hypothetical protein [Gallibacterium anatis]|nr:hypothetical protein [Gallibacterium anatis]WIM82659.1 hypothetical protein QP019_03090 [Gallibacterium anatis]
MIGENIAKTRQEMAQEIGEIVNNGITIVLKPKSTTTIRYSQ